MTDVPRTRNCATCNIQDGTNNATLLCCSRCKKLFYCSRTCQRTHWKANHKIYCHPPQTLSPMHQHWPEQRMPARIPPHNAHLNLTVPDDGGNGNNLLLHKDELTTYKLLIETFRVRDETKRIGDKVMEDPRDSWANGTAQYRTGYLYEKLIKHIGNAENMADVLPAWWDREKRDACVKVAREMCHWDDLDVGVPVETLEWRWYGGPGLRNPLRMLGMAIDGVHIIEVMLKGRMELGAPSGMGVVVVHGKSKFVETKRGVCYDDCAASSPAEQCGFCHR